MAPCLLRGLFLSRLGARDVKPQNIILEGGQPGGRVFLVDFGGVQVWVLEALCYLHWQPDGASLLPGGSKTLLITIQRLSPSSSLLCSGGGQRQERHRDHRGRHLRVRME